MTVHRRNPPNRTRKANPAQLAFAGEYRGRLSRNRRDSGKNLNPPDYEGNCTLNGTRYWISGWIDRRTKYPVLQLVFQQVTADNGPHQFQSKEGELDAKFGKDPPY